MSTTVLVKPRLRSADICRIFGVCPRTEAAWRARRKISFCKEGKVIWYTLECVVEFEVRQMVKAKKAVQGLDDADYDRLRNLIREVVAEPSTPKPV